MKNLRLGSTFGYIQAKNTFPIVIKADGLAAGKGLQLRNIDHAETALRDCFINKVFDTAGSLGCY